jgi:hypothetical protein
VLYTYTQSSKKKKTILELVEWISRTRENCAKIS